MFNSLIINIFYYLFYSVLCFCLEFNSMFRNQYSEHSSVPNLHVDNKYYETGRYLPQNDDMFFPMNNKRRYPSVAPHPFLGQFGAPY